ncbi:MAG: hypothetical protein BWY17_05299 [Deltaproteobacteria bacterium ADurb.Bin207]|nr:MAG: hypothetical protein BWY17_05299 [Deltaproteobacteria bacterium ADurb.Bin207]
MLWAEQGVAEVSSRGLVGFRLVGMQRCPHPWPYFVPAIPCPNMCLPSCALICSSCPRPLFVPAIRGP